MEGQLSCEGQEAVLVEAEPSFKPPSPECPAPSCCAPPCPLSDPSHWRPRPMKNPQRSHQCPCPPPLSLQGPPPAAAAAHVRGYLVGAWKLKGEAPGSNVCVSGGWENRRSPLRRGAEALARFIDSPERTWLQIIIQLKQIDGLGSK